MAQKRIVRDMDKVYDNPNAVCTHIKSYIYSKGDLSTNKLSNKFCNIEVLEANNFYYMVVTSGRLGAGDITVLARRFSSKVYSFEAYSEECKKREKDGYQPVDVISIYPNCSEAAKQFVSEKNLSSKSIAQKIVDKSGRQAEKIKKVSKQVDIHPKVQQLVKTIYFEANQSVKESLNPIAFQRSDNPLGMLNLNMINKGRAILDEIAKLQNKLVVAKRNRSIMEENIAELSNRYNSTIPRIIKRNSDAWYLNTGDKLMEQYELLDNMEFIISNALLNTEKFVDIESQYEGLNTEITLVTDEKVIDQIKEKMKIEQLGNHHFKTRLVNVFGVNQKNAPSFDKSCGNVVSLFHGTRGANLFGILSTHIKLPKNLGSNVQLTGHMFGPGCYFGQYSKCLQYSTSRFGGVRNKGNRYFLFICDVALGKAKFEPYGKNYAQAPQGYNSVMGVGKDAFVDGCFIKGIGETKDFSIPKSVFIKSLGSTRSALLHNEFIVYKQNRFKIRYIVEVEEAR